MSSVPPSPALTHRSAHLQLYLCGCSMSMRVGLGRRRYYRGDCENRHWHFLWADLCFAWVRADWRHWDEVTWQSSRGSRIYCSPGTVGWELVWGDRKTLWLSEHTLDSKLHGGVWFGAAWEIIDIFLLRNVNPTCADSYLDFRLYLTFLSYLLKRKTCLLEGDCIRYASIDQRGWLC